MRFQNLLVFLRLVHAEVVQQFAALSNHAEETAAGGVVFLVLLEVIREHTDLLGEDGDLNLRGARILIVDLGIRDQLLLGLALERHGGFGKKKRVKKDSRRAVWAKFASNSSDRRQLY